MSLGTDFMARLQDQLQYFVNSKQTSDRSWQGVQVYLSGHEVRHPYWRYPDPYWRYPDPYWR